MIFSRATLTMMLNRVNLKMSQWRMFQNSLKDLFLVVLVLVSQTLQEKQNEIMALIN
jgi:hypothetical protein